jgi:hypothetical protein
VPPTQAEAGPFSEDRPPTVEEVEAEVAAPAEGEGHEEGEEVIEAAGEKKPKQSTLTYLTPGWCVLVVRLRCVQDFIHICPYF